MAGTQFCDSSGLHTLLAAHKRAQAEGGELLLVVSAAPVLRAASGIQLSARQGCRRFTFTTCATPVVSCYGTRTVVMRPGGLGG